MNPNKATGPDNTAPRVLKACAEKLAYIFALYLMRVSPQILFQLLGRLYALCLYRNDQSVNDLRPEALTSAVMKVCERMQIGKVATVCLQEKKEY